MKVPGALGEYTMYPIISQSVTDDIQDDRASVHRQTSNDYILHVS